MSKEIDSQDQSEFNAGIATLMRLDAIKKQMINDNLEENYLQRYRDLAAYYLELVSIIKDSDERTFNPFFEVHKKNYRLLRALYSNNKLNLPLELIEWLDTYEMKLRNLEQAYGLNIPKKTDARFALAGGKH